MSMGPKIVTKTKAQTVEERAAELVDCTYQDMPRAALLVTEALVTAKVVARQVFGDVPVTPADIINIYRYMVDVDMSLSQSRVLRQFAQEQSEKQAEEIGKKTLSGLMEVPNKKNFS